MEQKKQWIKAPQVRCYVQARSIENGFERSSCRIAQSLSIGESLTYKWKSRSNQAPTNTATIATIAQVPPILLAE